jgi:predicted DNA-binding transcriptional regulator YafY
MNQLERIYKIDHLIKANRLVPRDWFLREMEISPATFKRDIETMRDRFGIPIYWDRAENAYRYDEKVKFELPGLWFNEQEAFALLLMHQLLSNLDSGELIGKHLTPLLEKLNSILEKGDVTRKEISKRFRVFAVGTRKVELQYFSLAGSALVKRSKLKIEYHARGTDERTNREISPQRLVYYKGNWYLDAWCHLRNGLRSFSLDCIKALSVLDEASKEVPEKTLDEYLASGYGIFSGENVRWAKLRFSAGRARWVASEAWHPDQVGSFDQQGRYVLELPYSNDNELIMDILRHGSEVEVVEPRDLRKKVYDEHKKAAEIHG